MTVHIIKTSFNGLRTRLVIGCQREADDILAALIMQHPAGCAMISVGPVPERSADERERARQLMELLFANEPAKKS